MASFNYAEQIKLHKNRNEREMNETNQGVLSQVRAKVLVLVLMFVLIVGMLCGCWLKCLILSVALIWFVCFC